MVDVLSISAHVYGNYHRYYEFHAADSRSKVLSRVPEIWLQVWKAQDEPRVFSILDIGCNEGNLSIELMTAAKAQLPPHVTVKLCGIDIDSHLIALAKAKYEKEGDDSIFFETIDVMDETANARFKAAYFSKHSITGFAFVCLFSITMWVHLNHGDAGLRAFLDLGGDYLVSNGNLLVEPQPWKCYKNAEKRARRLGLEKPKYLSEIVWRSPEKDITDYVIQSVPDMQSYWLLGKEDWGRSIYIYHRNDLPPLSERQRVVDTAAASVSHDVVSAASVGIPATRDEASREHKKARLSADS